MSRLLKYSVGTDISKEKFDACISVIDEEQRVTIKATRAFMNGFQVQYMRGNGKKVRETDKGNIVIWKTEKRW